MKTFLYTALALFAFAGNSILCRLALGGELIDAANFTVIRLLSGVFVLVIIFSGTKKDTSVKTKGSWKASIMLFVYAITFSYAYLSLETGAGALILFGAVQITMILMSLLQGNKLYKSEWFGVVVAFAGLVYLVLPDLGSPSLVGFLLMTISGIAWGFYTLVGKGSKNSLSDTTYNFSRTLPFVAILLAITFQLTGLSIQGIVLAALSGGVASAMGYAIWYKALNGLSATQAAVVQLLLPVIAAAGGVLFANEALSVRLIVSSLIIFGGILTVVLGRQYAMQQAAK